MQSAGDAPSLEDDELDLRLLLRSIQSAHKPEDAERFGSGNYTLDEASLLIALALRKGAAWEAQMRDYLGAAVESGALTLRDGRTGLYVPAKHQQSGWGTVTRGDVNAWLEANGVEYRWEDEATASPPAASVAPDSPLPLATADVAFAFAGLHQWDETKWKKALGNVPKWLERCRVIRGVRGGASARWDPVCIGAELVTLHGVPSNQVRGRFQSRKALKPWLEGWNTYEADSLDKD